MDKVSLYRQHIQELLTERAQRRSPHDPVSSETIFDLISDRYQLVHVGWKDSNTRIYGCVIHVDIKVQLIVRQGLKPLPQSKSPLKRTNEFFSPLKRTFAIRQGFQPLAD